MTVQKHHLSLILYGPSSGGIHLTFGLLGQSESLLDEEEERPDCRRSQERGREPVFLANYSFQVRSEQILVDSNTFKGLF